MPKFRVETVKLPPIAASHKPQNHRIVGVRSRTHCWYNANRECSSVRDCAIAGHCLSCFNPATSEAVRRGAGGTLWMWSV